MKNRTYLIVPEALRFFLPPAVAALACAYLGWPVVALVFVFAALFVLWFFRNPERKIPSDPKGVVSPADGRILKIEEVDDPEGTSGRFKKISIFMNVFNVHVNRAPCAGTLMKIRYFKGRFLSANLDKASLENERNVLLVSTEEGKDILMIQIAGLIARRIVCWVEEGMKLAKGERFGIICFGSRVEVLVPGDTMVVVSRGDKVTAGETTLGYLT